MRRGWRIIFGGATAMSVLLCAGVVLAWVWSYRAADVMVSTRWARGGLWAVRSERGVVMVAFSRGYVTRMGGTPPYPGREACPFPRDWAAWGNESCWWLGGMEPRWGILVRHWWQEGDADLGMMGLYDCRAVAVRYWVLVAIFGALPARRVYAAARGRRRRLSGRCEGCGYDLRATPERCPECGMPGERLV